jgi:predicted ATP-binding protein involved in virulence
MEDLRITGLTINNVGVFEHLELSFNKKPAKDKAEIHIFTGENGTGKTTLLEALTYFDIWFNKSLRNGKMSKHIDILRQKQRRTGFPNKDEINIGIYFQKEAIEMSLMGFYKQTNMSQFFESYYHDLGTFQYHNYNFFAYNGHRQLKDTKVSAFKDFEFNPITEALTFDKTNVNLNLFQWIANNKTRAALSFQKGNKKDSEKYLSSIQKIEIAIGEIIGRKVEFIIDEYSLQVLVKLDDESIHYNTLADGYKSIISWLTDLIFRLDYMPKEGKENFTLFLDEIDVHLHPAAQRRILPVIQKLFPNAQIFLTTHSPFVIGSVDDAWVYKFKLDEKGNSALDGEPFLTEDAKSYRYILEQVFDINKQFGIEIEKKLDDFYKIRDKVIKNSTTTSLRELMKISRELASQSIELRAIIGNEIKQLSRVLNKEISL